MMLAGPFEAAAALLPAAGIAKLAPARSTTGTVAPRRLLGSAEVAIGAYAVLAGDRIGAVAVALAYIAFAGVVLARWARSGPEASCECFGARPSRATPMHAVVDVAGALVASIAAFDPPGSLVHVLSRQPMAGGPFLVASATVAYLAYMLLTARRPAVHQ